MDIFIVILLIVLLCAVVVNIFIVLRRRGDATTSAQEQQRRLDEAHSQQQQNFNLIAERLSVLSTDNEKSRKFVDDKLGAIHQSGTDQFKESRAIINAITDKSAQLIENINAKLSRLDKTNQRIVDFSAQLQSLQDILKNPKHRGVMGEYILENVLSNTLPPDSFKTQYAFSDGDIVDAVVFVKDKIIPVDAKFSLENYERMINADKEMRATAEKNFQSDVKKRIDETSKYIKPEDGTTDFAFMFIPSEAIYYDLLVGMVGTSNMIEYAFRDRHVVIVSPTSFLAYLQTVLHGLRALEIEENAKHIKANVDTLNKHWRVFDEYMQKIGKTLGTTVGHYNNAYKKLGMVDRDVMKITQRDDTIVSAEEIDKPQVDR